MLAQPTVCCRFLVFVFGRFCCPLEGVMIRQAMSACCFNVWHILPLALAHKQLHEGTLLAFCVICADVHGEGG
jgi:hypothetical protein